MGDPTDRLVVHLAELGVSARVEAAPTARDGPRRAVLHMKRGASAHAFELVDGPDVRLTSACTSGAGREPVFVHTPHIAAKTGDAFRRAGVQYLDDAGNAWIKFGDVLIDVRGRPRPKDSTPRAGATGNLFSSGRAQVVLALLAWPELWKAPQREVAHTAGVSLGQAHNTLSLLAQAGYQRDQRRDGRADLLDLWAAAFPAGLAQRLTLAKYQGDVEPVKTPRADDVMAVSGEAAVPDLLRAATLTLYVPELNPRLAIVNRWRADGEPNIIVRRKFWHDPVAPEAGAPGIDVAPWPLVYADLLGSNDSRARAAAQQYRESHERPQ